jgi:hypothetical protein
MKRDASVLSVASPRHRVAVQRGFARGPPPHKRNAFLHGTEGCYILLAFCHWLDIANGADVVISSQLLQKARLEKEAKMNAVKCRSETPRASISPVNSDIRDFLVGRSNGEKALRALYDHVLAEPIPERLRALLRS